jgi:hypothetical protein
MWDTGDRSHAWNATPLYQMSGVILGVNPIEPGFKTFSVNPHSCNLKWAKGMIPTPHGNIEVAWHDRGDAIQLKLSVPNGASALCGGKQYRPGQYTISLPIGVK